MLPIQWFTTECLDSANSVPFIPVWPAAPTALPFFCAQCCVLAWWRLVAFGGGGGLSVGPEPWQAEASANGRQRREAESGAFALKPLRAPTTLLARLLLRASSSSLRLMTSNCFWGGPPGSPTSAKWYHRLPRNWWARFAAPPYTAHRSEGLALQRCL